MVNKWSIKNIGLLLSLKLTSRNILSQRPTESISGDRAKDTLKLTLKGHRITHPASSKIDDGIVAWILILGRRGS